MPSSSIEQTPAAKEEPTNAAAPAAPAAAADSPLEQPLASTTANLAPAPAPLVSAWGTSNKSNSPASIEKEKWPTGLDALNSSSSKQTTGAGAPAMPKLPAVVGGKKKWKPIEANIVFQSPNSNKKKSSNGSNNSNNKSSNNNSNNNKRKSQNNRNSEKSSSSKSSSSSNNTSSGLTSNNTGSKKSQQTDKKSSKSAGDNELAEATSSLKITQEEEKSIPPEMKTSSNEQEISNGQTQPTSASSSSSSESNSSNDTPRQASHFSIDNNNKPLKQKRFQHRNSEPFHQQNYKQQNHRHYNNNKTYNNNGFRHSIAGGYVNYAPYLPQPIGFLPGSGQPIFTASPAFNPNSGTAPLNLDPAAQQGFIAPPVFYPQFVNEDPITLVSNQVDYYFSDGNLVKDEYLRKQMNSKGFVPLTKLIEFKRLNLLTGGDLNLLKTVILSNPKLEFANDKVRLKEKWELWILPFDLRHDTGKVEEDEQNAEAGKDTEQ